MKNIFTILFLLVWSGSTYCQSTNTLSSYRLDSLKSLARYPSVDTLIIDVENIRSIAAAEGDQITNADCLNLLTSFYHMTGKFSQFVHYSNEALLASQDTSVIPYDRLSIALNNSSQAYVQSNRNHLAIELMHQSIDLEKKSNHSVLQLGTLYHNLSENYRIIGDYKNSLTTGEEAIKYMRMAVNVEDYEYQLAHEYFITGLVLADLNMHEKAGSYYLDALEIMGNGDYDDKGKRLRINCHHELARNFIDLDKTSKADYYLRIAKQIQLQLEYRAYKTMEIEGLLLLKKEDFVSANQKLSDALSKIKKEASYKADMRYPRISNTLAVSYLDQSHLENSLNTAQSGLAFFDSEISSDLKLNPTPDSLSSMSIVLNLLMTKAEAATFLHRTTNDTTYHEIAYQAYKAAIQVVKKMKLDFLTDESRFYTSANTTHVHSTALKFFIDASQNNKSDQLLDDIINIFQAEKSTLLINNLRERYSNIRAAIPIEIQNQQFELSTKLNHCKENLSSYKLAEPLNINAIDSLEDLIFSINENLSFLETKINREYPERDLIIKSLDQRLSIADIRESLKSSEAIIEYFISDQTTYGIKITREETLLKVLAEEDMAGILTEYQRQLSSPEINQISHQKLDSTARLINTKLLEPFELQLGTNLIIVPHDILSQIPFESLLALESDRKKYLIEQYNFRYYPSMTQYFYDHAKTRIKHEMELLCIAPIFEGQSYKTRTCDITKLGRLKYAEEEAKLIANDLNGKLISSSSTKPEDLTDNFQKYSMIHLATHACFNKNDPMLSEILFNHGSVTVYDLKSLAAAPSMVVLSACNTGKGLLFDGEGQIGLTRGFFEAGVQSVQSSLWSIDDYSSSEIIRGMYANLVKGQTRSKALQTSKLEYLNTADNLRSHPYFWAAMIHIGNDSPLFPSPIPNWIWMLSAIALLALGFLALKFVKKQS